MSHLRPIYKAVLISFRFSSSNVMINMNNPLPLLTVQMEIEVMAADNYSSIKLQVSSTLSAFSTNLYKSENPTPSRDLNLLDTEITSHYNSQ